MTAEIVEQAIACVSSHGQGGAGTELITVVSAFDVPKVSYDPVGRKMFADKAMRSLCGDAHVSRLWPKWHTVSVTELSAFAAMLPIAQLLHSLCLMYCHFGAYILQAKTQLYLDRLQLITQRMRRNKYFQANNHVLADSQDINSAHVSGLQIFFCGGYGKLPSYCCIYLGRGHFQEYLGGQDSVQVPV